MFPRFADRFVGRISKKGKTRFTSEIWASWWATPTGIRWWTMATRTGLLIKLNTFERHVRTVSVTRHCKGNSIGAENHER